MLQMDVFDRADLPFPQSLTDFQQVFPDEAACAAWLEQSRWREGFQCPNCSVVGEPFRFARRPTVFRCRKCGKNASLTVGTVMERTHTPLSVWFWGAYLVATQTPGMSAIQFQRQLGLSRYETAFQILHKLRASMVRPDADQIGSHLHTHVEVDETWIGGKTRGEGRGVHHKTLVAAAVEVKKPEVGTVAGYEILKRRNGRFAGRVRLAVVEDRSASTLCGFVEKMVFPKATIISDDWIGYAGLRKRGYDHHPVALNGDHAVADQALPIVHLVFSNLKTWLRGTHHGVSKQHLQAYLNEFAFRFNRRGLPFNAFRSLLGIAGSVSAPTYDELYSGEWQHPVSCGNGR
jgi:transposase-like protein